MNTPNLFISLEHYAKENFATETLAHILKTDKAIRQQFLTLLLRGAEPNQLPLNAFSHCDIRTQVPYKGAIIDLEIASASRSRRRHKLQIEVKTQSGAGDGQLLKYLQLDAGHVAYLTPRNYPQHRESSARFLGHFYWQDIYSIIQRNSSQNPLYVQFLKYLEVRNMSPQQPFKRNELRIASEAIDFLGKAEAIVQQVQEGILPLWHELYGPNWEPNKVSPGFDWGDTYYWWYRPRRWIKDTRSFYLELGIAVKHTPRTKPHFFVGFGTWHRKFGRALETDLAKKEKKLKSLEWTPYPEEWDEWGYRKFFKLDTGDPDLIAKRLIRDVEYATEELRKKKLQIINLLRHRLTV